jgi:hypothetical protein
MYRIHVMTVRTVVVLFVNRGLFYALRDCSVMTQVARISCACFLVERILLWK